VDSFEINLPAPECVKEHGGEQDFRAVFIRAPAVLEVGPQVEVLASYTLTPEEKAAQGRDSVAVAVRSGHLVATAFHPEITSDIRWHQMFVDMVQKKVAAAPQVEAPNPYAHLGRLPNRPADLPAYGKEFMSRE
jgi:5'-phosphate synthase pdxT subunit